MTELLLLSTYNWPLKWNLSQGDTGKKKPHKKPIVYLKTYLSSPLPVIAGRTTQYSTSHFSMPAFFKCYDKHSKVTYFAWHLRKVLCHSKIHFSRLHGKRWYFYSHPALTGGKVSSKEKSQEKSYSEKGHIFSSSWNSVRLRLFSLNQNVRLGGPRIDLGGELGSEVMEITGIVKEQDYLRGTWPETPRGQEHRVQIRFWTLEGPRLNPASVSSSSVALGKSVPTWCFHSHLLCVDHNSIFLTGWLWRWQGTDGRHSACNPAHRRQAMNFHSNMTESIESAWCYLKDHFPGQFIVFKSHRNSRCSCNKKKCIKTEPVSTKNLSGILPGVANGGGTDTFTRLSLQFVSTGCLSSDADLLWSLPSEF